MLYEIALPLHITKSILFKLNQLSTKRIQSPLNAIRYTDIITKLDKISKELTGLVNNIKEEQ